MRADDLLQAIWRHKAIFLVTVLVATSAAYLVGRSLPEVYSASATLFVGDRSTAGTDFEAIQSGQVVARTYAELIQSRTVAAKVAAATSDADSPEGLLARTEFKPVSDTQLVVISAEGGSATEAAELANVYASVFTEHARENLTARTNSDVSVADAAIPPAGPTRPRPTLYAAIAFVLSLFAGAALAVVRDRLDTRLGSDEEISASLDLPVLARIPRFRRSERAAGAGLDPYRVLLTNITFLKPRGSIDSVLVTSGGPTEGKSTSAAALARAVAEQGHSVIVVEGDLRRPSLVEMLAPGTRPKGGVTQYLALDWEFSEVVHETDTPNVGLVPCGPLPPNPATLLQPSAIARLIADARAHADFVVVDSPPLSAGADASLLGHAVNGVLFLVNQKRTTRTRAARAASQLRQARVTILGLVINEVDGGERDGYYSYGVDRRRVQPATGAPDGTAATRHAAG